ncbi:nitric oxide reductase [Burkholderia pseudomallei 1710a]|uniref:Nitric oxide reductase n=1 Tax=Burkholderia pseudomallei 1710a TaxID=320371 RepID=A0A0E1VXR9_BURPE|nr:nitric oxide reductase [Burkholderia pseudomallei 1710a]
MPFAIAALLMAFDFVLKLAPLFPAVVNRMSRQHGEKRSP